MSGCIPFRLNNLNRFFIDQAFGNQMANIFHSPFLTPLIGRLAIRVRELNPELAIFPKGRYYVP